MEFPRELRDPDSVAQQDDKVLHEQEERRLFYVAMTRARDSLTIYARQGKGKDPTPPGFLRDLVKDATLKRYLRERPARGFQTDLFGAAGTQASTRTAQWLELPPISDLSAKLSASAVQTYETCPLQFKLEREWRIPGEVPAAMQYGAAMHRVLRAYYDSVRFERPMPEDALIEFLRADLAEARHPGPVSARPLREAGSRSDTGVPRCVPAALQHLKCCTRRNSSKCGSVRRLWLDESIALINCRMAGW